MLEDDIGYPFGSFENAGISHSAREVQIHLASLPIALTFRHVMFGPSSRYYSLLLSLRREYQALPHPC